MNENVRKRSFFVVAIKVLLRTFLVLFLLLCLAFFGLLYYLERGFTAERIQSYLDEYMGTNVVCKIESISFSAINGLSVNNFSLDVPGYGEPFVSFSKAVIKVKLLGWCKWSERIKSVEIDDLFIHQLPASDGMRKPSDLTALQEAAKSFVLPELKPFRLTVQRPDILEITGRTVTCMVSRSSPSVLLFTQAHAELDSLTREIVDADLELDLANFWLKAHIYGTVYPSRINGIYNAIELSVVKNYSDNFELEKPAWGDARFIVGLNKKMDLFHITIDVVANKLTYCGVPFSAAEGRIKIDGISDCKTVIGPVTARRNEDVALAGDLHFDVRNNLFSFNVEKSQISFSDAVKLIDQPFTEYLPKVETSFKPQIVIRGSLPLLTEQTPADVNLVGSFDSKGDCKIENIPLKNMKTKIAMSNGLIHFEDVNADFTSNGSATGNCLLALPENSEFVDFSFSMNWKNIMMAEVMKIVNPESTFTNTFTSGWTNLSGRFDGTFKKSLNGSISVGLYGDQLYQFPIFWGLTTSLSDFVPGVKYLTKVSEASSEFTVSNGVFKTESFDLANSVFSIDGKGSFDLPHDSLDFSVTLGFFKKETFLGKISRFFSEPLTNIMLDYHVTGPAKNPIWHRKSAFNKLTGGIFSFSEEIDAPESTESDK